MQFVDDQTPRDRLYLKALAIRYERKPGRWLPIIWHLALRGYDAAMTDLADWYSADNSAAAFGKPADAFSPAGLYRRASRKSDNRAAMNASMSCFNRADLTGYRQWLRRAARAGDETAGKELRYFEIRLSHTAAGKIGRLRPHHKRDE